MTGHTPGPWAVYPRRAADGSVVVTDAGNGQVATLRSTSKTVKMIEADARLIAAAPDLLEACEEIASAYDAAVGVTLPKSVLARMRKAIQRARRA